MSIEVDTKQFSEHPADMDGLECFFEHGLSHMIRWVSQRRLSFGLERSVRIQSGVFEPRRGLFSLALNGSQAIQEEEVITQCRAMNAPATVLSNISRFFRVAGYVHFGFEASRSAVVGKCYLELPAPGGSADATVSGRLQFLGFKWKTGSGSMTANADSVVTKYRFRAVSGWSEACALLRNSGGKETTPPLDMLLSAIGEQRPNSTEFSLLEIEEEGSERRSYDLNLYDLNLPVSILHPALPQIICCCPNADSQIRRWAETSGQCLLGHVAAGVGRDDCGFLTVYFRSQG